MLKKTIKFSDLDGNEVTEEFYFRLNKAEIAEMELSHEGSFSAYLKTIIESQDGGKIIAAFKQILLASVGRRSEDGRRFIKNQEIRDDFEQSEAYSELFMELVTNADAASAFIRGIVPSDLQKEVETELPVAQAEPETPAYIRENREPTKEELKSMTAEQIQDAYRRKMQGNNE